MNLFPGAHFSYVSFDEVLLRLGLAAAFSFLLGLDREIRQKSFGLRTHMLLCIGTTAFVLILLEMIHSLGTNGPDAIHIDPSRVIQGVIIGIGFMGAGAFMRTEGQIIGATTGAGIWALGAVGLACGLGLYWHATILTALMLVVMVGMHPLDRWLEKRNNKAAPK